MGLKGLLGPVHIGFPCFGCLRQLTTGECRRFPKATFDAVVTNPPWGVRLSKDDDLTKVMVHRGQCNVLLFASHNR